MITGMHAIVFSPQADKARSFFADVLAMPSVDAGDGWLIFALPPAELAVHPADGESRHELYLMCDDIGVVRQRVRRAALSRDRGGHRRDDLTTGPAGESILDRSRSVPHGRHARRSGGMLAGSSLLVCGRLRAEQMFRARERPSRRGRLRAAVMDGLRAGMADMSAARDACI